MLRKRVFAIILLIALFASVAAVALPSKAEGSIVPVEGKEGISVDGENNSESVGTDVMSSGETAPFSGDTASALGVGDAEVVSEDASVNAEAAGEENASEKEVKLPAAGVAATLKDATDYEEVMTLADSAVNATAGVKLEDCTLKVASSLDEIVTEEAGESLEKIKEESYAGFYSIAGIPSGDLALKANASRPMNPDAVCTAGDYVHLRETASEFSQTTGVFYRDAVAEVLGEENGWVLVKSGNVTGYVRENLLATGEEAREQIDQSTILTATVNCDNLLVRTAPDKAAAGVEILPDKEEVKVIDTWGDWAYVETEAGTGYVYKPYTDIQSEYYTALTAEEIDENQKAALRKEMEAKALANIAYNAANGLPKHFVTKQDSNPRGQEVADFAVQFVGNPYVWGGTSLTEGCDCSGFVMSVYKEFGIELTHSTEIDQTEGIGIDTIENAEAGDIICYHGHVALYIGDGMIVHAAGEASGIRIAPACYDNILAVRRLFTD